MRWWNDPELSTVPANGFMGPMHLGPERLSSSVTNELDVPIERPAESGSEESSRMSVEDHRRCRCDKASPAAAVMLHLRPCYVSKAAILTVPVQVVPTENRSPA
jgi:hypothetical protein